MKNVSLLVVALGLLVLPARGQDVALNVPVPPEDTVVDAAFFEDNLAPHGVWLDSQEFGTVWQPYAAQSNPEWRPYLFGEWSFTDQGWTWLSQEPFGWIVYHFGRWTQHQQMGWVWVADTHWGPAWVSWRENEEFVGWAPLPPETLQYTSEFEVGEWTPDVFIPVESYVFVPVATFIYNPVPYFVPVVQTRIIFPTTRVTTRITFGTNRRVVMGGPNRVVIQTRAGRPVRQANFVAVSNRGNAGRTTVAVGVRPGGNRSTSIVRTGGNNAPVLRVNPPRNNVTTVRTGAGRPVNNPNNVVVNQPVVPAPVVGSTVTPVTPRVSRAGAPAPSPISPNVRIGRNGAQPAAAPVAPVVNQEAVRQQQRAAAQQARQNVAQQPTREQKVQTARGAAAAQGLTEEQARALIQQRRQNR